MHIKFTVHCVSWYAASSLINEVRFAACINGLIGANEKLMDEEDRASRHAVVISTGGKLLGCARLTTKGQVDRIAIVYQESIERIESAMIVILTDYAQITGMKAEIVINRINFGDSPIKLAA
jgi:hypothetical protein